MSITGRLRDLAEQPARARVATVGRSGRSLITTRRMSGGHITRAVVLTGSTRIVSAAEPRRWGMDSVARASRCIRRHCGGSLLGDLTGSARCHLCARGTDGPVGFQRSRVHVRVRSCGRCGGDAPDRCEKLCGPCLDRVRSRS